LAGAPPQTPLGSLQRSPRLPNCISGVLLLRKKTGKRRKQGKGEEKKRTRGTKAGKGKERKRRRGLDTLFWLRPAKKRRRKSNEKRENEKDEKN